MSTYKKEQRIEYFKGAYQLKRIRPLWLLLIILVFPAIFSLSVTLDLVTGGALPEISGIIILVFGAAICFCKIRENKDAGENYN